MAAHRKRRPEGALRESTYYVLAILTDGRAKSTSAIRKSVTERSAGYVKMSGPNVIGLLDRYAERGFIEVIDNPNSRRKSYRLTRAGYALWEADVIRLRHRLNGPPESNGDYWRCSRSKGPFGVAPENESAKDPAHE